MVDTQAASPQQPERVKAKRPERVLGLLALIFVGLAFNGVMNIFTSYGFVAQATDGHLTAGYVFATVAMVLTALSYINMARIVRKGGSAYAYAQKSFGSGIGFMVGWTILLDYLFNPIAAFLLFGVYLNAQFPEIPLWVYVLAAIVVTLVANLFGTTFVSLAGAILISTSVVLVAAFVLLGLFHRDASFADGLASLVPEPGELPVVLSGVSLLAVSFGGFDVVSAMSEEAKDPVRTVPRATLWTVLIIGIAYVAVSFVGAMVKPGTTFDNVDAAGLELMRAVGGPILGGSFLVVYLCSTIAAALVSQAGAARIIYAMGRDGVLPRRFFGTLVTKRQIPLGGIIVGSVIGLTALFVTVEQSFVMLAFGMLVAFSSVNAATVKTYIFDEGRCSATDLLRFGLLPILGFAMTLWLWSTLSGATFAFGLTWMALGFVYLLYTTRLFRRQPPIIDFVA